jgi:hypothetical protein
MSDDFELGYASSAPEYWQHGWKGVLPLPYGKKTPPPSDSTGYDGAYPSFPDIMAWSEDNPKGNIALRLPNNVVGIDVDHYKDKNGGETLAYAESLWGALPPTVRTTSRIDPFSGIRLYRVDPGTQLETLISFPGRGLGGIEIIQYFHRYAICYPSMHPDTGKRYRWVDHDGMPADIPRVTSLPLLPVGWVRGLRRQEQATSTSSVDVDKVLSNLPGGLPSMRVEQALAKALFDLGGNPGSRHDVAAKHVGRLLRLAEQGDAGVPTALAKLEGAFVLAVGKDRGKDAARLEFRRLYTNNRIHGLIADTPTGDANELAGIDVARIEKAAQHNVGDHPGMVPPGGMQEEPMDPADALLFADTPDDEPTLLQSLQYPDPVDAFLFNDTEHDEELNARAWEPIDPTDAFLFGTQPDEEVAGAHEAPPWGPVDVSAALAGKLEPEEPTHLARTDGKFLMYKGRVNALVGEPESGKSWVALIACLQSIKAGRNVYYIDFEDTVQSILLRLLALGATKDELRAHLLYAQPDQAPGPADHEAIAEVLETKRPDIVVVDGVNAAMTLLGLELKDNKDGTQFHQRILKPLTVVNSAVITIDHVPKTREARGVFAIGAQAKKAMTDGAMIGVKAVEQFGRGKVGRLELEVLKDKPGGVRAVSEKRRNSPDYLASVLINSTDPENIHTEVYFDDKRSTEDGLNWGDRQVILKYHQICNFLRDVGRPVTQNEILGEITGKNVEIRGALRQLVERGNVKVEKKGRSMLHSLITPYTSPDAEQDQKDTGFLMGDDLEKEEVVTGYSDEMEVQD